jgi:RNA polymerase sigma-70 factor (ECF subfamily)
VPSNNVEGRRMEGIADADLVLRAVAGERGAFDALIARYWKRLYVLAAHSHCAGIDPEDVVQETFVRAWRGLGAIRKPERVGSWLYTTALRVCQEGRVALGGCALDGISTRTPDPAAAGVATETRGHVREAVASLPEHYRVIVALRFFEGMKCEEIARHLGEPIGTVWTRIRRANTLLREKLRRFAPEHQGAEFFGGPALPDGRDGESGAGMRLP